jgi:iron complex transport system substrate-binding protein
MSASAFTNKGDSFPRRIVCLSDEASELIYLLGEEDRIVGVSGSSTRPPEVRSKPKVSTFRDANFEAIEQLKPDLIVTYSDVQGEISHQAALRGLTVFNFNQRSVSEIFDFISFISRMLGKPDQGNELIAAYRSGLQRIAKAAESFPHRPSVFFEEWNDPLISGIRWVEELVEIAGGEPIFPELRDRRRAKESVVNSADVISRNPDVIIASWCGMKANKQAIASRPGWENVSAVRNGQIYEIRSSYILQPGPASLTEGARQLHLILSHVVGCEVSAEIMPSESTDTDLSA